MEDVVKEDFKQLEENLTKQVIIVINDIYVRLLLQSKIMPSDEVYRAYKLKQGSRLGEFTLEHIQATEKKLRSPL